MRKQKLIHGIFICDIQSELNGIMFKYYNIWYEMIRRCYCINYKTKKPTYNGCSVCNEWYILSNFKKWFDKNYIENYHLDKDIIIDGNKVYSPDTCCFIPQYINSLFNDNKRSRGKYLLGVFWSIDHNKFRSLLSIYNKQIHLGYFDNELDAHNAWLKAKREYARKLAIDAYMNNEIDERIMNAIIKKAYNLK